MIQDASDEDVRLVARIVVEGHLGFTLSMAFMVHHLGLLGSSLNLLGTAMVERTEDDGGTELHEAPEANEEGAAALEGPLMLMS